MEYTQEQIKVIHAEDDREKMRTLCKRTLNTQCDLLQDALHALRNQRYNVTDEFIERSIDAAYSAIAELTNLAKPRRPITLAPHLQAPHRRMHWSAE